MASKDLVRAPSALPAVCQLTPFVFWQGNAAFKSGDYPFALSHYSQAIKLDPSQPTFFLNRAAVHLKLQQCTRLLSTVAVGS